MYACMCLYNTQRRERLSDKQYKIVILEGMHHEALEDNCLRMNFSATVYKIFKIYITRWS